MSRRCCSNATKWVERPILRAIVDLTTLEKSGEFEGLGGLVRVLNKKRGLQLVDCSTWSWTAGVCRGAFASGGARGAPPPLRWLSSCFVACRGPSLLAMR